LSAVDAWNRLEELTAISGTMIPMNVYIWLYYMMRHGLAIRDNHAEDGCPPQFEMAPNDFLREHGMERGLPPSLISS